jgi:hypothetical protein
MSGATDGDLDYKAATLTSGSATAGERVTLRGKYGAHGGVAGGPFSAAVVLKKTDVRATAR